MAVESAKLYFFTVQIKTVRLKLGMPKARDRHVFIQHLFIPDELRAHLIADRMDGVPRQNGFHRIVKHKLCSGQFTFAQKTISALTASSDLLPDAKILTAAVRRNLGDESAGVTGKISPHKHIFQIGLLLDVEPHLTVESAVRHIINHKSKRRYIHALPAVHLDHQRVADAVDGIVTDIHRECSVAAVMFPDLLPVPVDFALMRRPVNREQQTFSPPFFWNENISAVSADHLVNRFIKIMKRCLLYRMRKPYRSHISHVEAIAQHFFCKLFRKLPVVI